MTPYFKIISRWIKDFQLQNETIEVLRKNMRKYFFNFVIKGLPKHDTKLGIVEENDKKHKQS